MKIKILSYRGKKCADTTECTGRKTAAKRQRTEKICPEHVCCGKEVLYEEF